eukprot:1159581-Pelagomonas_calceolata.AAC.2
MKQGMPISLQDFTDDLRHRLRCAWRAVEGVDLRRTNNILATYQAFFALPFGQNVRKPIQLPGHLHLELPQHAMQNVSRFMLRAHILNVKTASWEDGISPVCDRCSCGQMVQGAVTGTAEFYVTHMLYADDLTLMANVPVALQAMLNRLLAYAQRKHLIINTAKSEGEFSLPT